MPRGPRIDAPGLLHHVRAQGGGLIRSIGGRENLEEHLRSEKWAYDERLQLLGYKYIPGSEIERQVSMAAEAAVKLLGLLEEDLAFFDAVHENYATVYDEPLLRDLIHDVVGAIKNNLKVDWTESHREDVKAAVRAAVKKTLRRRGVNKEDFEPMMAAFMQQAEALWKEWPMGA